MNDRYSHFKGNQYAAKPYPRDTHIHIRANSEIKKAGQDKAERKGISFSDYIEKLLFKDLFKR